MVENGSQDATLQIAQEFARQAPGVRVLQEAEKGKGRAVRRGMLAATGEYRFMCDADLSMPVEEISRFLPPAQQDYDLAIGSREAAGAVRYNEPAYRHLGGRLINTVIRLSILPGLNDTQCGFKCLHAAAAEPLFSSLTLGGWSFDIELLYLARRRGCRIREIPIHWVFNPESKLNVVQDAIKMMADIFSIHRNARRGVYGPRR